MDSNVFTDSLKVQYIQRANIIENLIGLMKELKFGDIDEFINETYHSSKSA